MFKDKKNILIAGLVATVTALIFVVSRQRKQIVLLSKPETRNKKPETISETVTPETAKEKLDAAGTVTPEQTQQPGTQNPEPETKTRIHQSPLLYVLTAKADGNVFVDPAFKDAGETFKKDEVVGLINAVEWQQLKHSQANFPLRIIYTKEYDGKKIAGGKSRQIEPRGVESHIKKMPVRFVNKDAISLNGTYYHPVTY